MTQPPVRSPFERFNRALKRAARGLLCGEDSLRAPLTEAERAWFQNQGDRTLRLNYELNEHSVVFDLGGYEGQWASDIFSRYCCRIHIFEPVSKFVDAIEKRFCQNRRIVVHRFGLADESKVVRLGIDADRSSSFKSTPETEEVRLVSASDFMAECHITFVDLMKINIEGAEYDLLDHLIDSGLVAQIGNLQVQFHAFVPAAQARRAQLQARLSVTHQMTYNYEFVWENWRRNQQPAANAPPAGPTRKIP